MNLGGLQKLTLLDYPGKLACTIFTPGCNFRCPFCHNAPLVLSPESSLRVQEVLTFLDSRRGKLEGICLTGGEPLLQSGVAEFLQAVREMGFLVKLDTNGAFPDQLQSLVHAGLVDYVAMDIKNCPDAYGETIGIPDFDLAPVLESVSFLLSGAVDYEFRTTVVREFHDEARLRALAQWIHGARRYYLQSFSDSGELINCALSGYNAAEMESLREAVSELLPCAALRGV